MMTVTVEKYFAAESRRLVACGMPLQEFTEQESLSSQPISAFVGRKEVTQLIAKDGSATRFQHYHRNVRVNLTAEKLQDTYQIFFGSIEHAEIVKGSSAAKTTHWHRNLKPRLLEHFQRRSGRFRTKVIVERVRPQNHLAPLGHSLRRPASQLFPALGSAAFSSPLLKTNGCEPRHLSLRCH